MKKVSDVLLEIGEGRENIERWMNAYLHSVGCDKIRWKDFIVFPKGEELVKSILDKHQLYYILAAATEVDAAGVSCCELIVEEGCDPTTDDMDSIRNRDTLYVVITLSKKSSKFLKN